MEAPQWIQRDFEGPVKIKSIDSHVRGGSTCTYQVDGSLDGKTGETIVPKKTIVNVEHDRVVLNQPVTLRYMRTTVIDIVGFHPHEWVGMQEQKIEIEQFDKQDGKAEGKTVCEKVFLRSSTIRPSVAHVFLIGKR